MSILPAPATVQLGLIKLLYDDSSEKVTSDNSAEGETLALFKISGLDPNLATQKQGIGVFTGYMTMAAKHTNGVATATLMLRTSDDNITYNGFKTVDVGFSTVYRGNSLATANDNAFLSPGFSVAFLKVSLRTDIAGDVVTSKNRKVIFYVALPVGATFERLI